LRQILPLQINRTPSGPYWAWTLPILCAGTLLTIGAQAQAQTTTAAYFPTGNYGYDQDLGVTVLTRARPEFAETGVQFGGFTVRPDLDQSIFDNSNVNGTSGQNSGSWGSQTAGTLSGQSDWNRNSLAATVGFDHEQYFSLPNQSYTNWNVGLGGGYTIGDSQLLANYSHSSYNQLGTTIGMQRSETPALDTTDTGDLSYTFNFGRFAVTPDFDVSAYRFGPLTTNGVQVSQTDLNRNVVAGGVVTRYSLTGAAGLLFVARGTSSNYIDPVPGQLSQNSTSAMMLTGLDYQTKSLWRYSLLAGVEYTTFAASEFGSHTAPIVSADVVYTPTGVLTITGTATRSIEDSDTAGSDGFVLSEANLVIDYELLRNLLLEGRTGFQYASYLQGGTQDNETVGGGVTWFVNRDVQLSLNDDFTNQTAPGSTVTLNNGGITELSGAYTQNILMITLHLGL
jgi:hypothetical protein